MKKQNLNKDMIKETELHNFEAPHLAAPSAEDFDPELIELWTKGLSMNVQFKMLLNLSECKYYLEEIKKLHKEIYEMERDPEWGDGPDRLVSRHISYNIFKYPKFESLYEKVRNNLPEDFKNSGYFIRGWVNQLNPGEGLKGHRHSYPLSGHVTIHGTNSFTTYKNPETFVAIESPSGGFHLMSEGVYHEVTINKGESPRVSVAFDVLTPDQVCPEFLHLLKEL
jgi:hypothetical protein